MCMEPLVRVRVSKTVSDLHVADACNHKSCHVIFHVSKIIALKVKAVEQVGYKDKPLQVVSHKKISQNLEFS